MRPLPTRWRRSPTTGRFRPLGTVVGDMFGSGGVLGSASWLMTVAAMVVLWPVGYLVLLPLILAVWPMPWRDVPGRLLPLVGVIAGGVAALVVVGLLIALRQA